MDTQQIGSRLHRWYEENKRPLPWRATKNPYHILLSEVMLQQTTVSVVIPYFEKFRAHFPKVEDLAAASEEQVHSLWSGLGYYSRARNLHRASKAIVENGKFPSNYDDLIKLPGVGPYTAAAVSSIAFDETVAAIDGNVIRVITRLFDISFDVTQKKGKEEIFNKASALIKNQNPAVHNQAMMELGATLCIPANPTCLVCPVNGYCASFKSGTVMQRPVKSRKKKQEPWLWRLFLFTQGDKIGLVKEANGTPWLKNTWVLPGEATPWKDRNPPRSDFKHSITHHKIFVRIEKPVKSEKIKESLKRKIKWFDLAELRKVGTSSVVSKVLKIIGHE